MQSMNTRPRSTDITPQSLKVVAKLDNRMDDIKAAEQFCCRFVNASLLVKLNANLNQGSHWMNGNEKAPSRRSQNPRFGLLEQKLAEEANKRQELVDKARTRELNTFLEVEYQRWGKDYRQQEKKRGPLHTPSARSSFAEESPRFAPNHTPPSKGSAQREPLPAHLLSFGGGGQPTFNHRFNTDQSSLSSKSDLEKSRTRDMKTSGASDDLVALPHFGQPHLFSFQQKNSPHKEVYSGSKKQWREDVIEELDEDARSSREEVRRLAPSEKSQDDMDDLEEVIERVSNQHQARNSRKGPIDSIGQKPSMNSVASNDSRDVRYEGNVAPHYRHLLNHCKQIDIKSTVGSQKQQDSKGKYTASTLTADPTRRFEDPRVSAFKLSEEMPSKKSSTHKDDSLGQTFESARRNLMKGLAEGQWSKESVQSKGRDTFLSSRQELENQISKAQSQLTSQGSKYPITAQGFSTNIENPRLATNITYSSQGMLTQNDNQPTILSRFMPKHAPNLQPERTPSPIGLRKAPGVPQFQPPSTSTERQRHAFDPIMNFQRPRQVYESPMTDRADHENIPPMHITGYSKLASQLHNPPLSQRGPPVKSYNVSKEKEGNSYLSGAHDPYKRGQQEEFGYKPPMPSRPTLAPEEPQPVPGFGVGAAIRQSREMQRRPNPPAGGFNIKIDIGSLSSKVIADLKKS